MTSLNWKATAKTVAAIIVGGGVDAVVSQKFETVEDFLRAFVMGAIVAVALWLRQPHRESRMPSPQEPPKS